GRGCRSHLTWRRRNGFARRRRECGFHVSTDDATLRAAAVDAREVQPVLGRHVARHWRGAYFAVRGGRRNRLPFEGGRRRRRCGRVWRFGHVLAGLSGRGLLSTGLRG